MIMTLYTLFKITHDLYGNDIQKAFFFKYTVYCFRVEYLGCFCRIFLAMMNKKLILPSSPGDIDSNRLGTGSKAQQILYT